jgi:hypothetical protein
MPHTRDTFEPELVDFRALWEQYNSMIDAASLGILDPGEIAEKVYGPSLDSACLFLYLFRRFGLPADNVRDNYKEACAFTFTTPHQEVFLRVSINGGKDTNTSFSYAVPLALGKAVRKETAQLAAIWRDERDTWAATGNIPEKNRTIRYKEACPEKYEALGRLCGPIQEECNTALHVVLQDFLRPVYIRDHYFNVLGEINPTLLEYDDAANITLYDGKQIAEYCTPYVHDNQL